MAKRSNETGEMIRYSLFLRRRQLLALRAIHTALGVPVAEQIRRALDVALALAPMPRKGSRP